MSSVPKIALRDNSEVSIKDEVDGEATVLLRTIFGTDIKQNMLAEPSAKCGEVFIGFRGNFTFVCAVCCKQYENLESFGIHIQDCHLKLNSPGEYRVIEDDVAESCQDPLIDSVAVESAMVKLELEDAVEKIDICKASPLNDDEDIFCNEIESTTATADRKLGFACKQCGCKYIHHRSYLAHARMVHGILTRRMRNKIIRETKVDVPCIELMPENTVIVDKARETKIHEENARQSKCEFTCVACNRAYKHRRSLRFHLRSYHGQEALSLLPPVRTEDLRPMDSNEDANDSSYSKPEEDYRCDICNRLYRHRRSLRFHIKTDHGDEALPPPVNETTCKYCDKEFDEKETLETHIQQDHPGDRKFMCPHCPKSFKCRATRQGHINIHTGERPFKCPHCSKRFSNSSNLTVHIRMHLQIKKHCCGFCGKRFVSSSEKKRHERTHTGEKLHQCEECGKQYPTRHKLNDHLRRHKNIKNYKCEVCNKTFYNLAMLKDHMLAHSQERPFRCEICGQSFPRKRALRVHEQLHSDVKKYVCTTCGKAFAQCAGLYSHRKSHAGIK